MHILFEIDIYLYTILFVIAGITGLIVRIDQWVEGNINHPKKETGRLDLWKSIWVYILTFILSGLAGAIVAVASSYFITALDSNKLILIAIMVGAIGKIMFYTMVDFTHKKIETHLNKDVSSRRKRRKDRSQKVGE